MQPGLGTDLGQKPSYGITLQAAGAKVMNQSILVFDRGLEEVQWWSVYDLAKGQHLFDTYVPVTEFSIVPARRMFSSCRTGDPAVSK